MSRRDQEKLFERTIINVHRDIFKPIIESHLYKTLEENYK